MAEGTKEGLLSDRGRTRNMGMSVFAQSAITKKYHRLGDLNDRHPFLILLEAEMSHVRCRQSRFHSEISALGS